MYQMLVHRLIQYPKGSLVTTALFKLSVEENTFDCNSSYLQ